MECLSLIRDSIARYLIPTAKRRQNSQLTSPAPKLAGMQRPIAPNSGKKRSKEKPVIAGRVTKAYLTPATSQKSFSVAKETVESEDETGNDEEEQEDVNEDNLTEEASDIEVEEDLTEEVSGSEAEENRTEEASDSEVEENLTEEGSNFEPEEVEEQSDSEIVGPEDSVSQTTTRKEATKHELEEEDEFEEELEEECEDEDLESDLEEELNAEARVHQFLDRQAELARRQQALDATKEGQWHPDEVALLQKLSLRGFEPLLPCTWTWDFRTLPAQLFAPKGGPTFINAQKGGEFYAAKSLLSLFTIGKFVRSRYAMSQPQEPAIKKELETYLRWAAKDGGYARLSYLPVLVLVTAQPNQSLVDISAATTSRLTLLAQKHRLALSHPPPGLIKDNGDVEIYTRKPPVLYGVIIIRSVIVYVTLDSGNPNSKVRTLANFDFMKRDMDVWNAFAVAILVCTARNYLMSTVDEMVEKESVK